MVRGDDSEKVEVIQETESKEDSDNFLRKSNNSLESNLNPFQEIDDFVGLGNPQPPEDIHNLVDDAEDVFGLVDTPAPEEKASPLVDIENLLDVPEEINQDVKN